MAPTGGREGVGVARAGVAAWMVLAALVCVPIAARAQTGTVTGRVTNAATGAGLSNVTVFVCTFSPSCTSATVNASGTYTMTVPAAALVAYTTGAPGFVHEVANDIQCPFQCDLFTATSLGVPFTVTSGSTVTKDFALSPVGSITGVVTDATTGAPLAGMEVVLATRFNNHIQSTTVATDAAGIFTRSGLGPGTYFAAIADTGRFDYVREALGGLTCIRSCFTTGTIELGTPIGVRSGAVTGGVNFALRPAGQITGTVRRKGTGVGQANVRVIASRRIGSVPTEMASWTTDSSGGYVLAPLPEGEYIVSTESPLLDEVAGGVACGSQCDREELAAGQLVHVSPRGTVSGLDFTLSPGGTVTGRLTDALTGTAIVGHAGVLRVSGTTVTPANGASTDGAGVFSVSGLPTGTYVVVAQAAGHSSKVFGGATVIEPTTAQLLAGTRVTVTDGVTTPNIDVALGVAATIQGRVRVSPALTPAVNAPVDLFVSLGGGVAQPVMRTFTDSNGNYTLTDIPGGLYQVATAAPRLDNQVYNGITCPAGVCTAAFVGSNGALIPATAGLTASNINLNLVAATSAPGAPSGFDVQNVAGGARLTWTAPSSGGSPASYVVEAGLAPGTTFVTLPAPTTSLFIPGIPPGTFFLRVRGVNGAGAGAASTELVLRVGAGGVVAPDPPDQLAPIVTEGRLTLTWQRPRTGPVPTSYLLEVGTAASRSDIAVIPTSTTVFQFSGVPPGVYFVRVRSVAGAVAGPPSLDSTMVVGNVPAPPGEPSFLTSSVAGNVVTIRWGAPYFGPVTDYVIEAGTQPGASNIAVFRTGNTATSITIPGVPPGRYYLRMRAVNAIGTSGPSFEHEMIVP